MFGDDSLIIDGWLHACSLLALQQVQGSFRNTGSQGWSHGWQPGWEDKGTHLADENISAQLVKTTVRAKWQVNVQQGGWEVSEEERGTVGWGVGWGGEVTEWVPLLLAWPLVLRVGEALRVSLPGGRNGLRKAKRGEGHSRGLGWGRGNSYAQLTAAPSFLLQDLHQVGASIRTCLMKLEGIFPYQPPNRQK